MGTTVGWRAEQRAGEQRAACHLVDHVTVDYALNELMQPVYDATRRTLAAAFLQPDLHKIQDAGLIRHSGRIYLRYYARKRQQTAAAMDQFTAERWVNDVHVESSRPASDPAWRLDVLTQALLFAPAPYLALPPWRSTPSRQSSDCKAHPEQPIRASTIRWVRCICTSSPGLTMMPGSGSCDASTPARWQSPDRSRMAAATFRREQISPAGPVASMRLRAWRAEGRT